MAPYCAGKAAVEQLVRVAAAELGPRRIRVNAVRPGLTRAHTTGGILDHEPLRRRFLEEIPLGRTGDPADIAEAIRYLAGPESGWVTGQSLAVDGGNELKRAPDTSDFYG
jgi:NAD(P)-dependent dehydrogenase (short-subunit alcohol dehydrogenase family)